MDFVNLYDVLQVKPTADEAVIKAAANALLKDGKHPDLGGGNTVARVIIEAKDILTDTAKRADHNQKIRDQAGKNKIGNYRIIRKIAEGGFGIAYEAMHSILKERVCIKHSINISDYDTQLLIREAKAVWNLRHHALPDIKDILVLDDGSCALVMSYIEGPTLQQVIEDYQSRKKEMDPENACWIMSRILDALRFLHYNGVVHGDVKPQNIIVQDNTHAAVLVDYGLASVKPSRKTKPDGYTPLFAAPESRTDKPPIPETDLFCLGLTMIYALGGDPVNRRIPGSTPKPIKDFLQRLVIEDVMKRPNWEKVNLLTELNEAREEAFGRAHTGNKKL